MRKGTKHKLGQAFIAALADDFTEHGAAVIAQVRENDPAAYLRVCASLVPKHVEVYEPLADLSDDELAEVITELRGRIADRETRH